MPEAQTPNLAAALVKAIAACKPVAHDAENTFHKYAYTSSEAIIGEARSALAGEGLAVIPLEQAICARDGGSHELVSRRLLVHTSGESVVCSSAWPIVPDRGRPLDKATAAADTV